MEVQTFLARFQSGATRTVVVPDDEWRTAESRNAQLALVFQYGQNMFQSVADRVSLSAGDYIVHPSGLWYLVADMGFEQVKPRDAQTAICEAVLRPVLGEEGYKGSGKLIWGDWIITYNPKPIPNRSHDFDYVHKDYDGAPDSGDKRCGTAGSPPDAMRACHALEHGEVWDGMINAEMENG